MASKTKPSVVSVQLRAGNKSAGLMRSIYRERAGRKLPTTIGSVDVDANLETGEGVRMKKPFTFADLTAADKAKIRERFESVRDAQEPVARPGFASLDMKLTQVLSRLDQVVGKVNVAPVSSGGTNENVRPALDRLEAAVEEAIADVRAQCDMLAEAGVKLSKVTHTGVAPRNPSNRMDQLQARANRVRVELLPRFVDACRELGLMKRAG